MIRKLTKTRGALFLSLLLVIGGFAGLTSASGQKVSAPTAKQAEVSNDNLSLNGVWQFALAKNQSDAERQFSRFHEAAFDARAFRPIPVPSNWSLQGFEEPVYEHRFDEPPDKRPTDAEGFYRHNFRVPASQNNKRAVLHFGGVWASAEVWLNGRYLGRHDSGFTAFAFDATRFLKPDGENTLAVRVRQNTKDTLFDTNDDWSLPGIYRDVFLEFMPGELYLDRIETTTDFDSAFRNADLLVRAMVVKHGGNRNVVFPYRLRAVLTDTGKREVASATFDSNELGGDNGQDVSLRMPVAAPAQWTAETPNLYDLRVDLLVENKIVHTRTERVGFRQISTSGGVLRINGQPVKLRGVNHHDEDPEAGRATRREHWLKDIELMKRANINAVRTSHYPPAEGFIKLCDELGMYVMNEIPMGYGGDFANDPAYASAVLLRAYETVARDRNRPSVIVWSIGNEDPFSALHLAAVRLVKGSDSTRPVLLPWRAEETLPPEVDMLAPHYKTGEEYDALAARARRPVITTEYSHALGDSDFGGLADRWQSLTKHPAGAGGMIWMWADQGLRRKVNGRKVLDPIADLGRYDDGAPELIRHSDLGNDEIYDARGIYGADGIVNPDRTPQRDYWETKAVYAPVSVLTEELPLTLNQSRLQIPIRNDFDFTNLSAIKIRWRLMADDRELAQGDAKADAAPRQTANIEIPAASIREIKNGVAYYAQLFFYRENGEEFAARSVRLITNAMDKTSTASAVTTSKPQISQTTDGTVVSVGNTKYQFDKKTAGLSGITANGQALITNSRPVLWRALSISEANLYRQAHREQPQPPDFNKYTIKLRDWQVTENGGAARIETSADYTIDERNKFSVRCDYRVTPDGALRIEYQITPQVETGWLPEIGIELETAPAFSSMRWRGLGIWDAYPNQRAAAMFGVWQARAGTPEIRGIKSDVEKVELTDAANRGLIIEGSPFVRFEADGKAAGRIRLLSAVVGRSTKFKRPERAEWQTDANQIFKGGFTVKAVAR